MNTTRGFHPRRSVQVRHLSRHGRGCDARSWSESVRLAPEVGSYMDRQKDERVFFELDALMSDHARELRRLHWHVPQGVTVQTEGKRFSVHSFCRTAGRLDTLVHWRRH